MARLPFVAGHDGQLLCYGGAAPVLHIVDVPSGGDLPLRTPADRSGDAVDRIHRIGPWLVFHQSAGLVALRAGEPGPWVLFDRMWGPVAAADPGRFWVTPSGHTEALLVDGDGHLYDRVPFGGPGMVRADVDGALIVEHHDGTNHEVPERGTAAAWADVYVESCLGEQVVAVSRDGASLLSMSASGVEIRRIDLEEGWSWSRFGSLSPDGRLYLDRVREAIPYEEVLQGRRYEQRRVVADLRTGTITTVDPGVDLGYAIWDPGSSWIYATTFRDIVAVDPTDGTVSRILDRSSRQAPLAVVDATTVEALRGAPSSLTPAGLASSVGAPASSRPPPEVAAPVPDGVGSLSLPAVQLVPRYGERRAARSHLGGTPRLPQDFGWPSVEGQPLLFVLQLDLAEVATVHDDDDLPDHGLLTVWFDPRIEDQVWGLDPADRRWWRVELVDPDGARRARPPRGLAAEARTTLVNLELAAAPTYLPPDLADPDGAWSEAELAAYEALAWEAPAPDHHLLGHPRPIQDGDMALQCVLAEAADSPTDEGWRLLLQVDSDSGAGLEFCGGGRLYIWVPRADLRAGRVDRCWIILQTD